MNYIAFEGIDYAGKSTQIALLSAWLTRRYYTPITLCEPTYGRYGTEIRKLISERHSLTLTEQIDLFTKDREQHVQLKIRPLLKFMESHPSFMIIQDRCYLSAPAYQGDSERSMHFLLEGQRALAPTPDLIFLIDVPVTTVLRRRLISGVEADSFGRKDILDRVRRNYLYLARDCTERIEVVDGRDSPESVSKNVIDILAKELH